VRRHSNVAFAVSAGLLVIGFGLITAVQASDAGRHPFSDVLFRLGVVCAVAGVITLVGGVLMYAWLPKEQRHEHADKRRHELRTGEKLESGRSLYSRNGRHRLEMAADGNVIEWADGIVVLWKTDTENAGASYLTLLPGGKLVVCKADGTEVKTIPDTEGKGGTRLLLQGDAQLVLLRDDNTTAWRTGRAIGVTWGAISR
jgi:hypothetical protein